MVQCVFTTETCSKNFNFAVFDEFRCQFDIILQNQNFPWININTVNDYSKAKKLKI